MRAMWIVLMLAMGGVTTAAGPEIHPAARARLEQFAKQCFRTPDGAIWSGNLAEQVERTPHMKRNEAYQAPGAPLVYHLATGETALTRADVEKVVAKKLGIRRLKGRVIQVNADGVLIESPGDNIWFLECEPASHPQGKDVDAWAKTTGEPHHTTALGAPRSVSRFVPSAVDISETVTWDELGRHLVDHKLAGLPRFTVRKGGVARETRSSNIGNGFQVSRGSTIETQLYIWTTHWVELPLPETWPEPAEVPSGPTSDATTSP